MLLLAAFMQGSPELLKAAFVVLAFISPYRASLCPLLPALQELSGTAGDPWRRLSGGLAHQYWCFWTPEAKILKRANQPLTWRRPQGRGLSAELLIAT